MTLSTEYLLSDHGEIFSRSFDHGVGETPPDVTTVTWSGRVADIIMLMIDSSGRQKVYIVDLKPNVNWEAVDLLERWLDEYDDDCDPDLDEQMRQLQANRLAFKDSADRS